jgi:hypothetical protein
MPVRPPLGAAPLKVRFLEGTTRDFLSSDPSTGSRSGTQAATEAARASAIESRVVLTFKVGLLRKETATFCSAGVPARELPIRAVRPLVAEGGHRIRSEYRRVPGGVPEQKEGDEKTATGSMEMPGDEGNGMDLVLRKNLPAGSATVHIAAFLPKPRLIKTVLGPAGEGTVRVSGETRR